MVGIGLLCSFLSGFFAYKLLQYGSLGVVNVIWHILHFIVLFVIGHYLLNEKLTLKNMLAVGLGMLSLALFEIGSDAAHHH